MSVKVKSFWQALFFSGTLALSVGANACFLDNKNTPAEEGEVQQDVYSDAGKKIGLIHLRSDGKWEAISLKLGALNESYGSSSQAADAICQLKED